MSNFLKPDVIWIEGRCYRMDDPAATAASLQHEQDTYDSDPTFNDCEDEDDNNDIVVNELGNGRYKTSVHVPKCYFGAIIGKKGAVLMKLERETRSEIKIPRKGHDGDVVILGPSVANLKTAIRRINLLVMSSRMKQSLTHFISIPCNNEEVMENFIKFKALVLQDCTGEGLEESVFILPTKLHLTVSVMALTDTEEILQASALLKDAANQIIRPLLQPYHPLQVRVKGLSYMNDDPKSIKVLYAKVQEENAPNGVLQKLVDDIAAYFNKRGISKDDHCKLHMTLMNARYRGKEQSGNKESDSAGSAYTRSLPFDGSQVLDKLSHYDFGVVNVTHIYLSHMDSYDENGYYHTTCSVSCSSSNN